ncbi:hypothetical protein AB0K51_27940 [Kitasatospora sp. NPDC049285]|uniref:hypothetical protein n=1 Tax=Kitasatospora sp. NPDC049285 TaxID=3157096 RepID=UPI003435AA32
MAWYQGPCRITVTAVAADFPQRAVVTVPGAGAPIVIEGTVGESRLIEAPGFSLALEHLYEGNWRPNIRAVQGKWTYVEGGRSQIVRSKDVDWPGDRTERNLVLRVDRLEKPEQTPTPTPARSATVSAALRRTTAGVPTSGTQRTVTTSDAPTRYGAPTTSGGPATPDYGTTTGDSATPRSTSSGWDSAFG